MANQRENLALRLRQNWLARENSLPESPYESNHHLEEEEDFDDSLTPLTWLQNLNIMSITSPKVQSAPNSPTGSHNSNNLLVDPNTLNVDPNSVLQILSPFNYGNVDVPSSQVNLVQQHQPHQQQIIATSNNHYGLLRQSSVPNALENIDYKTNPYVKPPYSYATLICMAMRASKKNKITLSGIYSWITENYIYYRAADPSWQNSIRHNLSLNKCFQKVARRKDEPGKGGFWKLNPEYSDMFVNGVFKKRRHVGNFISPATPSPKRIKKEIINNNQSPSETDQAVAALQAASTIDDQPNVVVVKQEPELRPDAIVDLSEESTLSSDDISWNALLEQDIHIGGGMKVKTGVIIDGHKNLKHSLSETPDDLEELLRDADLYGDEDEENPTDLCSGGDLDLTVAGIGIKPPEWWEKSLMEASQLVASNTRSASTLSTPIHGGCVDDEGNQDYEHLNVDHLLDTFAN